MNAKKDIAIVSEAASIGISLQADKVSLSAVGVGLRGQSTYPLTLTMVAM